MIFVAGGVEENDEQGPADAGPGPGRQPFVCIERAENQQRQDCVFGQMAAFAKDMVDQVNLRLGHVRKKPAQERLDKERGMLVGAGIGGTAKDERHPEQHRQPVFQEISHKKVSGFRMQDSRRKTPHFIYDLRFTIYHFCS
jgi:hypothetical protein